MVPHKDEGSSFNKNARSVNELFNAACEATGDERLFL
jgi:hypothetical protein